MKFTELVSSFFYSGSDAGLYLLVDCLGFEIDHDDLNSYEPFCVVHKDDLKIHLIPSEKFARKGRSEFRLETNDIEEVYKTVKAAIPNYFIPIPNKSNSSYGTQRRSC